MAAVPAVPAVPKPAEIGSVEDLPQRAKWRNELYQELRAPESSTLLQFQPKKLVGAMGGPAAAAAVARKPADVDASRSGRELLINNPKLQAVLTRTAVAPPPATQGSRYAALMEAAKEAAPSTASLAQTFAETADTLNEEVNQKGLTSMYRPEFYWTQEDVARQHPVWPLVGAQTFPVVEDPQSLPPEDWNAYLVATDIEQGIYKASKEPQRYRMKMKELLDALKPDRGDRADMLKGALLRHVVGSDTLVSGDIRLYAAQARSAA